MSENKVIIHHIRNATTKITYNGVTFLVDPMLAPKEYYPGFDQAPTVEQKKQRVPMVDLPIPMDQTSQKFRCRYNNSYTYRSLG